MEWITAKCPFQEKERVSKEPAIYAQGKEIFACLDIYEWPHDPNMTANALICVLNKFNSLHGLAPVLYLQLHNCVRENKNNVILCFLFQLVDLDVFLKVYPDLK